jgi:hypothetical protein
MTIDGWVGSDYSALRREDESDAILFSFVDDDDSLHESGKGTGRIFRECMGLGRTADQVTARKSGGRRAAGGMLRVSKVCVLIGRILVRFP